MSRFPTLFVSHGAPNMILHDSPARRFLSELGENYDRPRAILSVSAHFETVAPTVVADEKPDMIYDFGGFEPELYEMTYPAPGDAGLAHEIAQMLEEGGLAPVTLAKRGYDHGTWVPLKLIYPDADIPVVQLSVQPGQSAESHFKLGQALADLRDQGILVIGSGSFTHNLRAVFTAQGLAPMDAPVPEWVTEFAHWMSGKIAANDRDALLDYRTQAPHAVRNHPTDEHLMPLYVAMGAAGEGSTAKCLHSSSQFGAIMLDAFAFD